MCIYGIQKIRRGLTASLGVFGFLFCVAGLGSAADLDAARRELNAGNYAHGARLCQQALDEKEPGETWRLLLAEAYLIQGRLTEAQAVLTAGLERYPSSLRMRWLGHDILQQSGQSQPAESLATEIIALCNSRPYAYRDPVSLVLLGKAALLRGADPRQVLEKLFDQAKRADPDCRDAWLASGELALTKHDFELAAKTYREGLARFPADPDFHCGLAKAYFPSDRQAMLKSAAEALRGNPHHLPSLLLLADHAIDGERYATADELLDQVLAVNPEQSEAWAYRAVIRQLKNDAPGVDEARRQAFKNWPANPRVDHLIGLKLSQKYRFTEGSEFQRRALRFDPGYWPAMIQLAQDLLRLGQESEGWQLASRVHEGDAYDVVAFNLLTLKDTLAQYTAVTNADFIVRMKPAEAGLYGQRVLQLLARAKTTLGAKYGLSPTAPTTVEIFAEPKDFAVRTFGLPGESGYLGVCFGSVITANGPAAQQAHPSNWETMLWHEFAHVITLQMTHNKMPRWLSEGISVYEERQANPAWGQRLTPRFREMILEDKLTQVGNLSAVFLTATNALDLQFAYFESSLVVEFLVNRYGLEELKKVLQDLGQGREVNQALEAHLAPLPQIDQGFKAFALDRAQKLAPSLDWRKPAPAILANPQSEAFESWARLHPHNYWALTVQARNLVAARQFKAAQAPLKLLLEAYPEDSSPDNAYRMLAEACRGLNETQLEQQTLAKLATLDSDAMDVYLRLIELAVAAKDWPEVLRNTDRCLAVNPLVAPPHRFKALAHESLGQRDEAVDSYRLVLRLDPTDPAEVHYRLARLLHQKNDPAAKREVLQSLEEAPRYRDALRLLLEIEGRAGAQARQP